MEQWLRTVVAFVVAVVVVAVTVLLTENDLVVVALGVVTAAIIVGGIGDGPLLARIVVQGLLASAAITLVSLSASDGATLVRRLSDAWDAQRFTPLWSMPLAAFGVWVGADFRRSLEEIAGRAGS